MIGAIKLYRTRYTDADVYDGDIARECRDNAREEVFEVDDIDEAVRVFEREGLSFKVTGNEWAADIDGARIVNYATGEYEEVTAHFLEGFSPDDITAIIERVG